MKRPHLGATSTGLSAPLSCKLCHSSRRQAQCVTVVHMLDIFIAVQCHVTLMSGAGFDISVQPSQYLKVQSLNIHLSFCAVPVSRVTFAAPCENNTSQSAVAHGSLLKMLIGVNTLVMVISWQYLSTTSQYWVHFSLSQKVQKPRQLGTLR